MKIAAVDLFSGVGGLTYGLREGGVPVVAGLDADLDCKYAYETNNKATNPDHPIEQDAQFIPMDLSDLSDVDIEGEIGALFGDADIRILAGCAPCQAFSPYNHGDETDEHENYSLLDQFGEIVRNLDPQPHVVTMENTYEVRHSDIYDRFVETLSEEGYEIPTGKDTQKDKFRVYCPEYGVPQKRKRWVLLASRLGNISLDEPEYQDPANYPDVESAIGEFINKDDSKEPIDPITADGVEPADPLHRTRSLAQVNIDRINISEPGRMWEQWVEKGRGDLLNKGHKKESGRSFTHQYGRMQWGEPAPTITTQFFNYGAGRFGHPEYIEDNHPDNVNRPISLREGALLQTFPQDYEFAEEPHEAALHKVGRHIGNAVPPELAKTIGESIMNHIKSEFPTAEGFHAPSEIASPDREFPARVQQTGD